MACTQTNADIIQNSVENKKEQPYDAAKFDNQQTSFKPKSSKHRKQMSMPFDLSYLQASLAMPCDLVPQCGLISNPCVSVLCSAQTTENTPALSYLKGNGSIMNSESCRIPQCNDIQSEKDFSSIYSHVSKGDSTNLQLIPDRDNNISKVVRMQPSSSGLMTPESPLSTSSVGCSCVNPGTSHACASRMPHRLSLGVLNPGFEHATKHPFGLYPSKDNAKRKLSLDSVLKYRNYDLPEYPGSSMNNDTYFSHLNDSKDKATNVVANNRALESQPSSSDSSICNIKSSIQSSDNLSPLKEEPIITSDYVPRELSITDPIYEISRQSTGKVSPEDLVNVCTPIPDPYMQKLFTPDDLRDELLYPTTYGIPSEVYQNLNAREADFILLKPTRKPRAESLPSATAPEEQDSLDKSQENTADTERAHEEGNTESKRNSLSERRKSSLEKLVIPHPIEKVKPAVNVKLDNFDREEYIKFKKRLSASDASTYDLLNKSKTNSSIMHCKSYNLPIKTCVDDTTDQSESKSKNFLQRKTRKQNMFGNEKDTDIIKRKIVNRSHETVPSFLDLSGKISKKSGSKYSADHKKGKEVTSKEHSSSNKKEWNDDFTTFKSQLSARRNVRKQSLPTEVLFSNNNIKPYRNTSLNHLLENHTFENNHKIHSAFSPVQETDEKYLPLPEKSFNHMDLSKRHSIAVMRDHKGTRPIKNASSESLERERQTRQHQGQKIMSLLSEEPRKSKSRTKHKKGRRSGSQGKAKEVLKKSHHHHQKDMPGNPDRMKNQVTRKYSEENGGSGKKHRNATRVSNSKKVFKPNRQHSKSSRKASRSYLSPLGPGYEVDFPGPEVPYERLEESPTPTSIRSNVLAFAESSRNETTCRNLRRKSKGDDYDRAVDNYLSSSQASSRSSSPPSSISSSTESLSEYTSSSSSSSDSSDSESTSSSSSSSSSSTSSSSDSSDIQDLIL